MNTYIAYDDYPVKLEPFEFDCLVRNAIMNGGDKTWQRGINQYTLMHYSRASGTLLEVDPLKAFNNEFTRGEYLFCHPEHAEERLERFRAFAESFGAVHTRSEVSDDPIRRHERWELTLGAEYRFWADRDILPPWKIQRWNWVFLYDWVQCDWGTMVPPPHFRGELRVHAEKETQTAALGWYRADGHCLWHTVEGRGEYADLWRAVHVVSGNAARRAARVAWANANPGSHLASQMASMKPGISPNLIPLTREDLGCSNRPGVFAWKPRCRAWHILERGQEPVPAGYYKVVKTLEKSVIIRLDHVPDIIEG